MGVELAGSLGETRYMMCGEGRHKNERLIIHVCWDEVMQMHFHYVWRAVRCCASYISNTDVDPISLQTETKHSWSWAGNICLVLPFWRKMDFYVFWQVSIYNPPLHEKNLIAATPSYKNTHSHLQMNTEAFRHIDKQLLPTGNYWGGKGC